MKLSKILNSRFGRWTTSGVAVAAIAAGTAWLNTTQTEATSGFHPHDHQGGEIYVSLKLKDKTGNRYMQAMKYLNAEGFDVAGVDFPEKIVDVLATPEEFKKLEAKGWEMEVLTDKASDMFVAPDDGYRTPQEIKEFVEKVGATYPDLVMVKDIGTSHEGREIWAVKISDNPKMRELDEPTILFNSMHHAREVMSPEVAIDIIEELTSKYGKDAKVTDWVNNNEIWVVPMLNPDGNNKVWTTYALWRKNTRGGYGVDLNRNYPYNWNACGGSSGSQRSDTYRGPSPGSEPESQALMALVKEIRPVFDISYHSYSELVLYPYGCRGKYSEQREIMASVGLNLAKQLPNDGRSGHYTPGTPPDILYSADGGDIDWMHGEMQVIPFVVELNSRREGFQPSYARWRDKTVQKNRAGWGYLLDRMHTSAVRGMVTNDKGVVIPESTITIEQIVDEGQLKPLQIYRVNPDGTYHVILLPGNYQFTYDARGFTKHVEMVNVDDKRVDLNIELK